MGPPSSRGQKLHTPSVEPPPPTHTQFYIPLIISFLVPLTASQMKMLVSIEPDTMSLESGDQLMARVLAV